MFDLEKIAPATYKLPQKEGMLVPGLVIATKTLLDEMNNIKTSKY